MNKHVLFIQGGGEDGYKVDKELVNSLQTSLGQQFEISYPEIESDESASDFGWIKQIAQRISEEKNNIILVGHSFGASMILKYLSENSVDKTIKGVFLLATPFWSGTEDWEKGLKLQENFAEKLPRKTPIAFYHCQDDEEVPFSNLARYKLSLPQATFKEIKSGGHQLSNDLTLVANDIRAL
jgi:predicted alpha/beta hydrolase family esterase